MRNNEHSACRHLHPCSKEMIEILPSDLYNRVRIQRLEEIKDGKTIFARWIKSKLLHHDNHKSEK